MLQISAGANHSAIIAKNTHRLYTFGQASHGQLGLGAEAAAITTLPTEVADISRLGGAVSVSAGEAHTVVILRKD